MVQWVKNPTSIHDGADSIPGLTQWVCCRLAAAALIQPLAWELPYAMGVSLKSKNKQKKEVPFEVLRLLLDSKKPSCSSIH